MQGFATRVRVGIGMSPTRRELVKATRVRILDAAARLAREHGPNGFSMDVLAKDAGVARATVYEHFRSKRALLDALAASTSDSITLEHRGAHIGDPLTALRDVLGAVCRHWHEREDAVRELGRLAAATGADAPTDAIDHDYLRRVVAGLASAGHLRPRWSVDDAVDALALLTSFPTYERLRRTATRTPAQIEALVAMLAVSIVSPNAT